MKNKLYIVGAGPGDPSQLTAAAAQAIAGADCVVAAARHLALVPEHKKLIRLGKFEDAFKEIEERLALGSVTVLVSGDPGVYSLMPLLVKRFADQADVEVLPGICSLQYLCASAAEKWDSAVILSGHGREVSEAQILDAVDENRLTIFFCGPGKTPQWFCRLLSDHGLGGVRVTAGERLSYEDERVTSGPASELAAGDFDPLSVVLAVNEEPWRPANTRPRDCEFLRTEVPMTRECVRAAIVDALALEPSSVLWDLGAGTGSVTVAAAMQCRAGAVIAVERNKEAAGLVRDNLRKFHLHNVTVVEGDALEAIKSLPKPTHIFIGGGGNKLPEIANFAAGLGGGVRVTVAAVTLKTYSLASEILSGNSFDGFEAEQIAVSRTKKIGGSVIMAAQNPVTVFSAVTRDNTKGAER